jgi:hypothetical protein
MHSVSIDLPDLADLAADEPVELRDAVGRLPVPMQTPAGWQSAPAEVDTLLEARQGLAVAYLLIFGQNPGQRRATAQAAVAYAQRVVNATPGLIRNGRTEFDRTSRKIRLSWPTNLDATAEGGDNAGL